jgi:hypothetical protein
MRRHEFSEIGLALEVNGFNVSSFGIRRRLDPPGEVDLLIEYPVVGLFSIDDRFDLVMRRLGEDVARVMDLAGAKLEICSRLWEKNSGTSDEYESSLQVEEMKRRQQFRRVKEILYQSGIACLEGEWPSETDYLENRVVLYVPRALQARIRLRRAGFRQDLNSASLLQDPETGLWVELSERPCDRQG